MKILFCKYVNIHKSLSEQCPLLTVSIATFNNEIFIDTYINYKQELNFSEILQFVKFVLLYNLICGKFQMVARKPAIATVEHQHSFT